MKFTMNIDFGVSVEADNIDQALDLIEIWSSRNQWGNPAIEAVHVKEIFEDYGKTFKKIYDEKEVARTSET